MLLVTKLDSEDNLRIGIIALAVANNDVKTLEMLKAIDIKMRGNSISFF
jgi:hypothetical protein